MLFVVNINYAMDCLRQKFFMFALVEEAVEMAWVLIIISLFSHFPSNKIYQKNYSSIFLSCFQNYIVIEAYFNLENDYEN